MASPGVRCGGAGEIGHMVVEMGGARCPCGRRGCMEAYAGRAAMEARARKRQKEQRTDLFKIMKERGRTKLTSSVWARALERKDRLATELINEAVEALGAGIASAINLLDVPGGGHRRRPRRAPRGALREADPEGDAAASVQRRPPSGRTAGGSGRPRRVGRGRVAGQAGAGPAAGGATAAAGSGYERLRARRRLRPRVCVPGARRSQLSAVPGCRRSGSRRPDVPDRRRPPARG